MKKTKMTHKDREDAHLLKRVWLRQKKELLLTQEKAGESMGISQGAVGQYINGITPLNIATKLKFSNLLKVPIKEIWPDFQYSTGESSLAGESSIRTEGHKSDEHAELVARLRRRLDELSPAERDFLVRHLESILATPDNQEPV